MTKRMKLNNNGKFIKALSVAALAGLSFLGVNANAEQTVIENQHAESQTDDVYGGAINNPSGETIDSLDVILRDNSAISTAIGKNASGGAIYNVGTVNGGNIGDVTGNYAQSNGNSYGGAIYTSSSTFTLDGIGNIKNNHAIAPSAYGGAVYNFNGNLGVITGEIEGNYVIGSATAYGGAIYVPYSRSAVIEELNATTLKNNYAVNGTLDADGNFIPSNSGFAEGGAIYNTATVNGGTIGEISGNYVEGGYRTSGACGGAIYNSSSTFTLDAITGDIKNNHVKSYGSKSYGGAIYNEGGNFGVITGAIEDNYIESNDSFSYGGAIYNNSGTIEELNATSLKNNYIKVQDGVSPNANGGAIYNKGAVNGGTIGEISGNYAESNGITNGGAIYNESSNFKLDAITGDIKNNHALGSNNVYGGAIYNEGGNLGIITGAIEDNYIQANNGSLNGGAIYNNNGTIEKLNAATLKNNHAVVGVYDEDGNYVSGGGVAYGGAIYNAGTVNGGTIGEISGNYVISTVESYGGAIENISATFKLDAITGDIKNNYAIASASNGSAIGGAIYNSAGSGNLGVINGVIENNYVSSGAQSTGGAINNYGIIEELNSDSIKNNYAKSDRYASGGAILNSGTVNGGTIGEITGNYAESGADLVYGGAIYNTSANFKLDSIGDIIDNHATSQKNNTYGGAISNNGGNLGIITGAIEGNYVKSVSPQSYHYSYGGAIYNYGGNIGVITGAIENNYAKITGTANGTYAQGGAIYNTGTIEELNATTLKNNYVSATNGGGQAYGGAIYNTGTVNGGTIGEISGNYAEGYYPAYGGAIYNTVSSFTLDEIGDIKNNHATSSFAPAQGGAIFNQGGNLGVLNGAIKDNYAVSGKYDDNGNLTGGAYAYGGAIYNVAGGFTGGNVTEISGNYAEGFGGAMAGVFIIHPAHSN